jgi:hypothetical protein
MRTGCGQFVGRVLDESRMLGGEEGREVYPPRSGTTEIGQSERALLSLFVLHSPLRI